MNEKFFKIYFLIQFDELYPTIYKSSRKKICSNFALCAPYKYTEISAKNISRVDALSYVLRC